MKLLPCLLAITLLACGSAQPPAARAPAARSAAPAPPAPVSTLVELPAWGLSVRLPGPTELVEYEQQTEEGPLSAYGVACSVGSQHYFVARYFRHGRNRATDEAALANMRHSSLKAVSRESPTAVGEWSGIELEGKAEAGVESWLRIYPVGDGFWLAQVRGSQGKLERAPARAFLDSIELRQPWSVHAFPAAHFSALFPDGGVHLGKKELKGEQFTVAEASWVGGTQQRTFAVWAIPLASAESVSPEERMNAALDSLIREGYRVIWQAPLVVDGAPGRDFLMQNAGDGDWTRLRVIVSGAELYMLQATAKSKAGLLDDSVPRFLASLRWY